MGGMFKTETVRKGVGCPKCLVEAGQPCKRDGDGVTIKFSHADRVTAYKRVHEAGLNGSQAQ